MSSISIAGTGNMARTIGKLAVAGGNTVEVMGRDQPRSVQGRCRGQGSRRQCHQVVIKSLGLRPLDVGDLNMAHWLEGAALIVMGLARNGVGHWDFGLDVAEFSG